MKASALSITHPPTDVPLSPPVHVALIGLPGSGKSTVGRQLARRLGWTFLDTDQVIEKRLGLPIREFFEREGEASFRDLEQAVIDELTLAEPCVLATGGGAVIRAANREHLKQRSHSIYLHSLPEEVFRRLRHDQSRPLLQVTDPLGRLRDLYTLRDPLYRESASVVVETGRPTVPALVQLIACQLEAAGLLPAAGG